ncbi:hypothetical protein V8E51_016857 [Hyaloscypha variabilis]
MEASAELMLPNEATPSCPDTIPPEPMEEEFEELTDEFTHDTLVDAALEIDGLLIEEQWKRVGGEGSAWEQALLKHRAELQEGVTWIKAKMKLNEEKDALVVDIKEIPTIVVQELESEDDKKMPNIFEVTVAQEPETDIRTSPQSPSKSSALQDLPTDDEEFIITGFLSEEEANASLAYLGPAALDRPCLEQSLQKNIWGDDADFERLTMSISDEILVRDQDVLLKSSEEPLSTFLASVAQRSPIKPSSTDTTQHPVPSNGKPGRGTKRGSDEAELDVQGSAKHADAKEREGSTSPAKKRQELANRLTIDPSKLLQVPKTPSQNKTLYKKAKGTPASRHSPRKRR